MDVHFSDKHLDDPSKIVAIPKVAKVSEISVEKSIRVALNKKKDLYSFFVFIDVDESTRQNLLSVAASSKEAADEWKSIIEKAIERMVVIAPSEDVESQMIYVEDEDDGEEDGVGSDDGAESNNGSSRSIARKSSMRGLSFNPIASASARSINSGPSSPKVGSSAAMDVDYSDNQSQVSSQKKQHFTMIHRASSLFLHKGSPVAKAFEKEDPSMSRGRTYNPFAGKGKDNNKENWHVVTVTDGVHIYGEKEFKKDFPQLRASVEVPASAKEVVKLILDDSQRSKWDDSIESYEVVKNISTFAQLVYVKLKPFWVGALWTGARDLIMMRYWREDPMEDNPNEFTYTVVWQSVDDPAYYKSPEGYTRGKIFSMGFTVRPLTEKTSFLESSCHADPGGAMSWMPNSVIQKWIQPFMLRVLGIRKLLDEKSKLAVITGEEEKKQANKSSDATAADETPKKKRSSFARKRNSVATGTPLNAIKEVAAPVEEKAETDVSKTAESSNQDATAASESNEETTHADTPTAADTTANEQTDAVINEQAANHDSESTPSQNVDETTTSNENETTAQQESNDTSVAVAVTSTEEAQSTEAEVEESPKQSEEPPARPASIKISQEETAKPAPVPAVEPPKKRPIYNREMKGSFAAESWMATPEDDPFPIRGKTYLADSKKIPSEKHKFELVAVSVDSVETQTPHIAARSDSLTWALKEKYENRFQFIVQFMAGEFSLVLYLLAKPGVLEDGSAFAELFNDFIEGTNEYRDNRFKLIPRVVKGAWILKKAVGTTPAILGKKLTQQYFPGPHYFEVDVNVNSR